MYCDTEVRDGLFYDISRLLASCFSTDNRTPQSLTNLLNVVSSSNIAMHWWLNCSSSRHKRSHHHGLLQSWQVQVLSSSPGPGPVSLIAVVTTRHHHPGLHPVQTDPGLPHDRWHHRPHHRLQRQQPRVQVAHLHDKPGELRNVLRTNLRFSVFREYCCWHSIMFSMLFLSQLIIFFPVALPTQAQYPFFTSKLQ